MQGEPSRRYLRECWVEEGVEGGWWAWCALLPNQHMSTYSSLEQQEEAHILLYNLKYLGDITLPLLNKANNTPCGIECHALFTSAALKRAKTQLNVLFMVEMTQSHRQDPHVLLLYCVK